MEDDSLAGWKREEKTGLWIPDIANSGLNALKEKKSLDPKKYAKPGCKYCHGKGEMRRSTGKDTFKWCICMCIVKRFPQGKKDTEALVNMDFGIQERKNKGVLK